MHTPKPSLSGRALRSSLSICLGLLLTQGCTPAPTDGGSSSNTGGSTGGKSGGNSGGKGGSGSGGSSIEPGGSGGASGGSVGSGGSDGGSSGNASGGASGGSNSNGDASTASGGSSGSDAAAGMGGTTGAGGSGPVAGLGPWTGNDNVPPSPNPPGGLKPAQVPMFVSMGFDDGNLPDGVSWVSTEIAKLKNPAGSGQMATYDGSPVRVTFYDTSTYGASSGAAWKAAYTLGHELGNHTVHHAEGGRMWDEAMWTTEIKGCIDYHVGPPVSQKKEDIWGFRSPFLHYNGATMAVVKKLGFWYDCSIEEGVQTDQDGTNYLWPYTLDSGSPGNAAHPNPAVVKPTSWPKGLWEMPAYKVLLPPDADAAKYGVPVGLRAKMKALHPDGVGINEGKITGLDYNLWSPGAVGAYQLNKAEFVATMKYTLDQRLKGNRAPFLMGMHTFNYSTQYAESVPNANVTDRRAAVLEFLNWAVSTHPEVRVVTTKAVLDWIRNPVPLK